jgi:NAD(P)-dependent dehydrogenase (short-subunit alcohol dehydrogenase family)
MNPAGGTFLVTGGIGGLGAACARRLVAAGARTIIADLDADAGKELATQLGPAAWFAPVDVTDELAVRQAIGDGVSQLKGPLRGAINCAGVLGAARVVGRDGPHDLELFTRIVRVNLIGTFNVVRLAAAVMADNSPDAEGERGVIINTSSIAATDGQIGQAAYAASKAGVAGMTLPISRELARLGIRVVTIAPGVFDTPMMQALTKEARASLVDQASFPPRLGRPDEFAAMALHVIENPMLNGTVIRLDGGLRMAAK